MTQKKSSKTDDIEEKKEDEIEVNIEGDDTKIETKEAPKAEIKEDEDVATLRKRIDELTNAQGIARAEAERHAQQMAQQLNSFKQSAEQSQYDTIVTAMGAAQIEVDAAKRDIALAGAAQDYPALADAQERLSGAKAHMVSLEQGKQTYDSRREQPNTNQSDSLIESINQNPNLSFEEKGWLRAHPEALTDSRKNAKLNAAYFDAMDKGLQRGTTPYFTFIEEQLGYRQPEPKIEPKAQKDEEESSVMVAAPPSKSVPSNSGAGGKKTSFTMTKDEAEIARLSGITAAEYVKQREIYRGQKTKHPDDYPER